MMDKSVASVLDLLGLARRGGMLAVGQDSAISKLRGSGLYITTDDCSESVRRKIDRRITSGRGVHFVIQGVSRDELGRAVGVLSAQIVALPLTSPFAARIEELLKQGAH